MCRKATVGGTRTRRIMGQEASRQGEEVSTGAVAADDGALEAHAISRKTRESFQTQRSRRLRRRSSGSAGSNRSWPIPRGVIVVGHTRRLAALTLGWTTAPTVTITAKHAKAYRLADNRSGEFSSWNMDVLPMELADLSSEQLTAMSALDFGAFQEFDPPFGPT